MNIFKKFGTNKNLEKGGVVLDYSDIGCKIVIARAGGDNQLYAKEVTERLQQYQRKNATKASNVDPVAARGIMIEIFAKTIIKNWYTQDENGKFVEGLPTPEGTVVPFTREGVVNLLKELPDLFDSIQTLASDYRTFQDEIEEDAVKN